MIKVEPVTSSDLNERLAYSVDEVAAITGLSRDLLYDDAGRQAGLPEDRSAPHHHTPASRSLLDGCYLTYLPDVGH